MRHGAKTRSISMAEFDWRAAQELANANTEGNVSELLRRLVHFATMTAESFDLQKPSVHIEDGIPKQTLTMEILHRKAEQAQE